MLPLSETFVRAQAAAVDAFLIRFVGLQPARPTLDLPSDPILLSSRRSVVSRTLTRLYAFSGVAPGFHKRIRDTAPSMIHAHFAPDGVSGLRIAQELKIPLAVSLHGYDVNIHDRYLAQSLGGRQYLKSRARLCDAVSEFICTSEFTRRQAVKNGFPEAKLRVHYIGVNRAQFAPAERSPHQRVLFVGRLVENKGCGFLLKAMSIVRQSVSSAELVVIGEGPLRRTLEQEAARLSIKCEFLGHQPTSVVQDCLAKTSMLCIPSITAENGAAEGLGMVALEAQARGRPVVGFRTGGIPEAVRHGETGLLAAPSDHTKLAEHIVTYLTDERFWQESSRRAVQWIANAFDLEVQTRKLESIYAGVIGSKSCEDS